MKTSSIRRAYVVKKKQTKRYRLLKIILYNATTIVKLLLARSQRKVILYAKKKFTFLSHKK